MKTKEQPKPETVDIRVKALRKEHTFSIRLADIDERLAAFEAKLGKRVHYEAIMPALNRGINSKYMATSEQHRENVTNILLLFLKRTEALEHIHRIKPDEQKNILLHKKDGFFGYNSITAPKSQTDFSQFLKLASIFN